MGIVTVLFASAITLQTPADSDLFRLVPVIIDVAVTSAAKHAPHATAGPLFVDLSSFSLHGSMAIDSNVSTDDLRRAVGRPFREAVEQQVVRCSTHGCSVSENGLFIRVDGLARTPSGFQALLTYQWTDRRPSGNSAIGETQLRVWLVKAGVAWVAERVEVMKQT